LIPSSSVLLYFFQNHPLGLLCACWSGSSAVIGAIAGAGATALAMQAMNNANRSSSNYSNSRPSTSYSNSTVSRSTASVSRGGFGGAVSSGG
jgi:hypothetical protein